MHEALLVFVANVEKDATSTQADSCEYVGQESTDEKKNVSEREEERERKEREREREKGERESYFV